MGVLITSAGWWRSGRPRLGGPAGRWSPERRGPRRVDRSTNRPVSESRVQFGHPSSAGPRKCSPPETRLDPHGGQSNGNPVDPTSPDRSSEHVSRTLRVDRLDDPQYRWQPRAAPRHEGDRMPSALRGLCSGKRGSALRLRACRDQSAIQPRSVPPGVRCLVLTRAPDPVDLSRERGWLRLAPAAAVRAL